MAGFATFSAIRALDTLKWIKFRFKLVRLSRTQINYIFPDFSGCTCFVKVVDSWCVREILLESLSSLYGFFTSEYLRIMVINRQSLEIVIFKYSNNATLKH